MRPAPKKAPGTVPEKLVVEERTYRFITPVFGSGVEVRKPDPVTPVRVPSIRGQLRFWWRACNPRGCTTISALYEAEAEVFGSTKNASPLSVHVAAGPKPGSASHVLEGKFGTVKGMEDIAYGAFPLRDSQGQKHGTLTTFGDPWILRFTCPKPIAFDVETAFWAWAHFGGLGGRTRRGFGAIEQVGGVLMSVVQGWKEYVRGIDVPWPHLPKECGTFVRRKAGFSSGLEAQKLLLGTMKKLRQSPTGRKPKPEYGDAKNPGRSYWPEADSIRELTGQRDRQHANPVTNVRAFPRARFGMPIIFHFKSTTDPKDTTLKPPEYGRFSSPLVLRPHAIGQGRYEAMAVVLRGPFPEAILDGAPRTPTVPTTLTQNEAATLGVGGRPSPLTKNGKIFTDPLLRYLEEIG
jgi:CRISPR-associated protein Cmr1